MTQVLEKATGELLLAGFVKSADFVQFLHADSIPSGPSTLMLLEALPRHVVQPQDRQNLLYFAPFDPDFNFTQYTSGRIFHAFGEIHWERQQEHIQIVYTGKREYKPQVEEGEEQPLDGAECQPGYYLLFGKRLDTTQLERIGPVAQKGDFAEVRIPRLLRYPLVDSVPGVDSAQEAERVQLVICEYRNPDTGANIAYRFKGLVPFQKKQE